MTFVFELRGLIYGLLTVTSIASITALTTRLVKHLLPPVPNFQPWRLHIDSRDALSHLIVSWEVIPSLLKGSYSCRALRGKRPPPPLCRRLQVLGLFAFAALVTIAAETTLILSTGSDGTTLFVPDVVNSSFLARHIVQNGADLPPLRHRELNERGCLEKSVAQYGEDAVYASYEQWLCVRTKVRKPKLQLRNWTLATQENLVDSITLWLGWVELIDAGDSRLRKDKHTYGSVRARITRRITYLQNNLKRLLTHDTAMRIAREVRKQTGCAMVDAGDGTLDRDVHGRPSYIANFTCNEAMDVPDIIDAFAKGILEGFGEFEYSAKTPQFVNANDSCIINKERKHKVGLRVSESFETQWFIGLIVMTGIGMLVWCIDRVVNNTAYSNVGLLSIMFDLAQQTGGFVNEIYRKPVVLAARASADMGVSQPRIYYGYTQRGPLEVPLYAVAGLPQDQFTFR